MSSLVHLGMDDGVARRTRRGAAVVTTLAVLVLHGLGLALLVERPPAAPRAAPVAPALWTRSVPARKSPTQTMGSPSDVSPTVQPGVSPSRASTAAESGPAAPADPSVVTPVTDLPALAPDPDNAQRADADLDEPGGAVVGAAPPPLYVTRLPVPALLRYQLRRGEQQGEAQLRWRHEDDRYELGFEARAAARQLFQQHSRGRTGTHGLAPDRFHDKRRGRSAQVAQFDAEGGRIFFGTRAPDLPWWPGAQDRAGWIVQLASIVAAAPVPPPEVQLFVVGARGGAGWWTFVLRGAVELDAPAGRVMVLHYDRAPAVLRDQRVEAWLDPARGHWPARLRFTPVLGGPPLELLLDGDPVKP